MDRTVSLGTVRAAPGERARGYWPATDLPTGTPERLPVASLAVRDDGALIVPRGRVSRDRPWGRHPPVAP